MTKLKITNENDIKLLNSETFVVCTESCNALATFRKYTYYSSSFTNFMTLRSRRR